MNILPTPSAAPAVAQKPMLQDRFGRRIDYLRVSVTDRCDLRCTYCLPKGFKGFHEPKSWLSFAEIEQVVAGFARLGVAHVRLTGGEPLLRRNLPDLVAQLHALPGISDIALSTNATQLASQAQALKQAGLTRLNISLDSLDRASMARITGRDCLPDILAGIRSASRAGFKSIKLNMVVQAGVNEHEVEDMVRFAADHGLILRLIETMPMGATGQQAALVNLQQLAQQLQSRFDLHEISRPMGAGPARYLESRDGRMQLGFITPMSQHFCATCNRVRLAVDGTLYMCLGQNEAYPLRDALRRGLNSSELEQALRTAIELKPERHEFREKPTQVVRFMSATGG